MKKKTIIDDLTPELEEQEESVIKSADKEYKQLESEIELDINHITAKLSEIQKYIVIIETIIDNLQNNLLLEGDQKKQLFLSKTILVYIEKLALLQDTYYKYLALKQDYRAEQNRIITNKNKLKIDLIQKEENDTVKGIAGVTQLVDIFKKISSGDSSLQQFIKQANDELNEDLYKID